MHRMWNHVKDSRNPTAHARNFLFNGATGNDANGYNVNNNLAASNLGLSSEHGKGGKILSDLTGENFQYSPWDVLDDNKAIDNSAVSWGYGVSNTDLPSTSKSLSSFDASWELGRPMTNTNYRWFQGSTKNLAANEAGDESRLTCQHCEIQYALKWDPAERVFKQFRQGSATAATDTELAYAQCNTANPKKCEYSSGVCFVEERRTFGYITLIRKGCKQAKACYMNKYQNFLVQAGRQCWPGDNTGSNAKVARRPNDVKADEWIYNLVKGGTIASTSANEESFKDSDIATNFDDSFTDADGIATGFYITADTIDKYIPQGYVNGMHFTSKCYQCCNTGNNCNLSWQPSTESDWGANYLVGDATP